MVLLFTACKKIIMPPKILILLSSYNGSLWIEQQLESILNQVDVDLHIFLRDDNSSDGTQELLLGFYKDNPKITFLFSNTRSGSGGASFKKLFLAANISDFNYVAYSDQDDIWFPNKLSRGIFALKSSGASGYSSSVIAFWEDGKTKVLKQNTRVRMADFIFEGAGQGCSFVLTTDAFKLIQQFCKANTDLLDNFYYHDWLSYLLVRSSGFSWYFDPLPTLMYRQHEANDTGARSLGIKSVEKRLSLIRSGWYKKQVSLALAIHARAGTANIAISDFANKFSLSNSFLRKFHFTKFVLCNGRRRLLDRLIIVFSSLFGWI
jgi:rhamnosyltransferase